MNEEKCLNCGRVLFRRVRVDDVGHTVIRADFGITMESDGFEQFFRCPDCQTQHVVANKKNLFGIPSLTISHMKP